MGDPPFPSQKASKLEFDDFFVVSMLSLSYFSPKLYILYPNN